MKSKSKMAPHPGEVLRREYLEPIGLSGNALAMALHVPATRISEILHGRRSVTADTALRLECYFGQANIGRSAMEWMHLQVQYDLAVAMKTIWPRIKMEVRPRRKTA
jgi:addiction module HigA family antidote